MFFHLSKLLSSDFLQLKGRDKNNSIGRFRGGAEGAAAPSFLLYFQNVLRFRFENRFIRCSLVLSSGTLTLLYFTSRIRPQCCMLHVLKSKVFIRGRGRGGGLGDSVPSFWIFWVRPWLFRIPWLSFLNTRSRAFAWTTRKFIWLFSSLLPTLVETGNCLPASYLDEFQFKILWHLIVLTHAKDVGDDVLWSITHVPQMRKNLVSLVYVPCWAGFDHLSNQ